MPGGTRTCHSCSAIVLQDQAFCNRTNERNYFYCARCSDRFFPRCNLCNERTPQSDLLLAWDTNDRVRRNVSVCRPCINVRVEACVSCGGKVLPGLLPPNKVCYQCSTLGRCIRCNGAISAASTRVDSFDTASPRVCNLCFRTWYTSDTFKKNPSHRLVGLEIEYLAPTGAYITGLGKWGIIKGDGSVSGVGHAGREFNSVPANGDRLFNLVDDTTTLLVNAGCTVNNSCGLHVHLDMRAENSETRQNLQDWWHIFEFLILGMVQKSRWSSDYAKKVTSASPDDRYRALNVTALHKFGTYEVRLHHGTLNNTVIKNWVLFLLSFWDTFTQMKLTSEVQKELLSLPKRALVSFLMHQTKMSMSLRKNMLSTLKRHEYPEAIKAISKSGRKVPATPPEVPPDPQQTQTTTQSASPPAPRHNGMAIAADATWAYTAATYDLYRNSNLTTGTTEGRNV